MIREALDRRYLLVPSPAVIPKQTTITQICTQLENTRLLLPQTHMYMPKSVFTFIYRFIVFFHRVMFWIKKCIIRRRSHNRCVSRWHGDLWRPAPPRRKKLAEPPLRIQQVIRRRNEK